MVKIEIRNGNAWDGVEMLIYIGIGICVLLSLWAFYTLTKDFWDNMVWSLIKNPGVSLS